MGLAEDTSELLITLLLHGEGTIRIALISRISFLFYEIGNNVFFHQPLVLVSAFFISTDITGFIFHAMMNGLSAGATAVIMGFMQQKYKDLVLDKDSCTDMHF